jgi:hypothetical protein
MTYDKEKKGFERIMNEKVDMVKVVSEACYNHKSMDKITGKYFHDKLWSWIVKHLKAEYERGKRDERLRIIKIIEEIDTTWYPFLFSGFQEVITKKDLLNKLK